MRIALPVAIVSMSVISPTISNGIIYIIPGEGILFKRTPANGAPGACLSLSADGKSFSQSTRRNAKKDGNFYHRNTRH
jgi:hypothetical protein